MTADELNRIWDVLVELGGAHESMRDNFKYCWPECVEYRFMGALGYGGKIWHRPHSDVPVSVNCYREDETPKRLKLIAEINARLTAPEETPE